MDGSSSWDKLSKEVFLQLTHQDMNMPNFSFEIDPMLRDGAPSYRFFKLVFTAALRLKLELPVNRLLQISAEGSRTTAAEYRGRVTFAGRLVIDGREFTDIIFIVDQTRTPFELVTFWKKSQRGEVGGAKTGAHSFAEAYMGYLTGKTLGLQCFPPSRVIQIADEYNSDPKFNITAWIIKNSSAQIVEPKVSIAPIEKPILETIEEIPPLALLNKWTTDVRGTGIPYTNYELDACLKDLKWSNNDRIECKVHWENGQYITVQDFGRFDRFLPSKESREKLYNYLNTYSGNQARARLILTIKGDGDQWTLASATMMKRLKRIILEAI